MGEDEFGMPVWMECQWRRIACGESSCPICGMHQRLERELEHSDGSSLKHVPEDEGPPRNEALAAIKFDAESRGFEIANIGDEEPTPEPDEFPLYRQVHAWREHVVWLAEEADRKNAAWLQTEEGKDLLWYANTIAAKTYRQLTTRWELNQGSEYGVEDYQWTQYVLRESCTYVRQAAAALLEKDAASPAELMIIQSTLEQIEPAVLEI